MPLPSPSISVAPSSSPPRELTARDVRDLALAVVEGAVAAEALAKELKRSPDRSKHFAEIAERLRAVVNRPSIRRALADDPAPNAPVVVAQPPNAAPVADPFPGVIERPRTAPPPLPAPRPIAEDVRPSGERIHPGVSADTAPTPSTDASSPSPSPNAEAIAHAVVAAMPVDAIARTVARTIPVDAIANAIAERTRRPIDDAASRLAHLEQVVIALGREIDRERVVIKNAADAIALAGRLAERAELKGSIVVKIE